MSPQFSENLLIKIYVEVDDWLKAFQRYSGQRALGKRYQPTRTPELSVSEVITI
jgi:hypothetical protein